jgi:hypothetical protein
MATPFLVRFPRGQDFLSGADFFWSFKETPGVAEEMSNKPPNPEKSWGDPV